MSRTATPPRQARSRETLERVLASAEELFADRGQPGFTIPEVSRRAGVSVGTVYRRFANKEALLIAVLRRVQEHEATNWLADWETVNWTALPARTMVARLATDLSRTWRERERLMRATMARRLLVADDEVFAHGLTVARHQSELFARAVATHRDEIRHPDPDVAIDFAYRLIVGMCARWTARTIETQSPEPMAWDTMLEQLTNTVTAYLFAREVSRQR